jgi:hypothetical protein
MTRSGGALWDFRRGETPVAKGKPVILLAFGNQGLCP